MRIIDTRGNLNIAILMEMLEDVSRATRPNDAREAFTRRIAQLRPIDAFVGVSVRDLPPGHYKVTRYVNVADPRTAARELGSEDPWKDWPSLPTFSGGLIGKLIADPEPKLVHDLFLKDDPVLGDRVADMGSCLATPLFDSGRALNWALQFRRAPEGYTLPELSDHLLTNNLFGSMTRNLVGLEQIRALNTRLREQFEQIARVQQALLPTNPPRIPGVSLATSYLTSEQAGGDYYDFFDLGRGRWGLLIADVAGHGPPAATVMAMLHAILHAYPGIGDGPAAALRFANKRLCAARTEGSFTTAVFGMYNASERTFTLARAGHPSPLLRHGSGVDALEGPFSLPLGIDEGLAIEEHTLPLSRGQTVVLYTDGITEAFNAERRMFGIDGVRRAVAASTGRADDVVDSIHLGLYQHTGRRTREDDQTILAMQVGEPGF